MAPEPKKPAAATKKTVTLAAPALSQSSKRKSNEFEDTIANLIARLPSVPTASYVLLLAGGGSGAQTRELLRGGRSYHRESGAHVLKKPKAQRPIAEDLDDLFASASQPYVPRSPVAQSPPTPSRDSHTGYR